MDAGRFPACVAGFVPCSVDPVDAVVHADLPRARHPRPRIAGVVGPRSGVSGECWLTITAKYGTLPNWPVQWTRGPTAVNHYRDLLAGTFMVRVLPPWFENLGKRLVKSPKVYLRDSGVLHHLLGIEDPADLPMHPRYGASWEGFALEQTLIAHGAHEAYFYATQRGAELDLLLLRGGGRWGFEFKCTDAPKTTKAMHTTTRDLGLRHLWIVYPGTMRYSLTDGITALPLANVGSISFSNGHDENRRPASQSRSSRGILAP